MKASEVKALTGDELARKLDEKHKELFELRFKAATKQLKNHRQIPGVKKDIARLLTRRRELEAWQG